MSQLTEEQGMIGDMAARFTDDVLRPNAAKWDREHFLDRDVFVQLGELGFGGIYTKEEFGGSALSRLDAVLIFEQLSKGCISHAAFLSIHNMATAMIDKFGDDRLRAKYLPQLTKCDLLASYCLTEPNSGSDAASLQTKAVLKGEDYVLNGSKVFISGGNFSDIYVVMARTSDEGARGISTFVVPKGAPGLSFGKTEEKMGWRAQPTCMVNFDDCRIPASNLVGVIGEGFKYAMAGLDGGRLNIASASLGGAQEALDRAIAYTKDRKQFGQSISDFQATQFKLADMDIDLRACRAMLYEAARKLDANAHDATPACAAAKRFVTDKGFDIANEALQLHGGYGYLSEYEIERIVRDLRVHKILEGTNEVMRMIVSRSLLA